MLRYIMPQWLTVVVDIIAGDKLRRRGKQIPALRIGSHFRDDRLTKAEASKRIDELQGKTGRGKPQENDRAGRPRQLRSHR